MAVKGRTMPNGHYLIVEARFYEDLAEEMAQGAMAYLKEQGATCERIAVPGALEIPAAIKFASLADSYDGFIALGVVIRGETSHYDYVCNESARGLQDLAIHYDIAVGNGILTVENFDQAWARAAQNKKNKGAKAAEAAMRMVSLKEQFKGGV